MKLKALMRALPQGVIKGSREVEVTGVCSHSKWVAPGNVFIARRGMTADGNQYVPEAIQAGAKVVVSDLFDPTLKGITQVICPDVALAEGALAAAYYGQPAQKLFLTGVTGTNGKTTTTWIIQQLLHENFGPCGMIGTIAYRVGNRTYHATHTTPDVVRNHRMLKEMVDCGCPSAVMEVTSHALDQGRVNFIDYDVAVFTNLTQDHLDYHKTMEAYFAAKRKLFLKGKKEKLAVIAAGERMVEESEVPVMTYGIECIADLVATDLNGSALGTEFVCHYQGKRYPCFVPLIGHYNILNCLAALGACLQRVPLESLVPKLSHLAQIPGRLERIDNERQLTIFVDFAHTEDALKQVLSCLRPLTQGKLSVVFGCGGDRDPTKRSKMGRVCSQLADEVWITSDNPRSENPLKICEEVSLGCSGNYHIEPDRRGAMEKAINAISKTDILLIAGRGHETEQLIGGRIIPFHDATVVREICA
ncbi:MAG: UDP-N-acetylmuramoyl-L-alanyl-D-glutamate--2,6-diaminopimelate ligase [Chlamydiia bacterium]|nr:UDP-N-acetylmuramoyl-L-alanyl-D-glutamate--2,6-diaminopimelate ligase [Chlamydiia bacterium]